MSTLTRYVYTELLKVFLLALAGMTFLLLIVGLAQEAIRQGLGVQPLLRLIPYAIPNALRFAVPGTILFAVCSVFGRMASTNEVVALKSLGISPSRLLAPALTLGFAISVITVWLNDVAVSWGREGMQRVVLQSLEEIVYGVLCTQRSYSSNGLSINVKDVDGRKLLRPSISLHRAEDETPTTIRADQAELQLNPTDETLTLMLVNAHISLGSSGAASYPGTLKHEIPLSAVARKSSHSHGPSSLPMWRIRPEIESQRREIERLRQDFTIHAAGLPVETSTEREERLAQENRTLEQANERLCRLETEAWRRWANGFSCLFFVMVGAPLAMRMRNSDLWSTFAIVFLPVLIAYYPLLALGVDRAKSGDLPPYSVWLGNVILAIAGGWLIRRAIRY